VLLQFSKENEKDTSKSEHALFPHHSPGSFAKTWKTSSVFTPKSENGSSCKAEYATTEIIKNS